MNTFQDIFDAQKALFATGGTRTYEWRVEQLDRMARMIKENEGRFQKAMAKDFKTASQEYIFETQASAGETEVQKSQLKEWMKPVEAPVPRFLAETGHKGMEGAERVGGNRIAMNVERVVDGGVNGQEPLRRSGRVEALHLPLVSSHRQMRILGTIVLPLALFTASG